MSKFITKDQLKQSLQVTKNYVSGAIDQAVAGAEVDLTNYATKSEVALKADKTALNNKVDKVAGKSLIADTEITRLASVTNYNDSALRTLINGKANSTHTHSEYLTSANLSGLATETFVNGKISALTNGASEALDTLKEIGDALNNDANFAGTMTNALAGKVDKVSGKSLISDTEITRLASVKNYDDSAVRTLISGKVDKVTGKSLVSDTEIARLAQVSNYNDADVRSLIAGNTTSISNLRNTVNGLACTESELTTMLNSLFGSSR